MKSHNARARSHRLPATFLIFTLVALSGPAALAQWQVASVLYGMWDGEKEVLLVNGDSLGVSTPDFYEVGLNAQTETATMRCSQHTLRALGTTLTSRASDRDDPQVEQSLCCKRHPSRVGLKPAPA